MGHKIILSADSTCDLGDELRQRYHVQYYPFHVILDGKAYSDGVDLVPDQIYQVYEEKHILPKTAAINAAEYVEYFKKWTDQGYEVIHVTLGSGLSATYQNCCLAAKELPGGLSHRQPEPVHRLRPGGAGGGRPHCQRDARPPGLPKKCRS